MTAFRLWLLRLAREALQLCRTDLEAGEHASALLWLQLAHNLRVTAGALHNAKGTPSC